MLILKSLSILLMTLMCLALAFTPSTALGHGEQPRQTWEVQAGPYTLEVELYADPVVGQPLPIRIIPLFTPGESLPSDLNIGVELVPGLGTNATPIRAEVRPDPDNPAAFVTEPVPPVVGAWVIQITASGPQGEGAGSVPVTVAGPNAMPAWVAWLIGLVPLLGVALFAWWQWRWMKGRPTPDQV
jgi:hypothetical protein